MAQEPDRSNMDCLPAENFSTVSKKYYSHLAKPFKIACFTFPGKWSSRTMNWCKLSRRKSAQVWPPWPSKIERNWVLGQRSHDLFYGFWMLSTILTRSSLYSRISPWFVLAAYDLMMPFSFYANLVGSWLGSSTCEIIIGYSFEETSFLSRGTPVLV